MSESVVSVVEASVPGQKEFYGVPFPLVLSCESGPHDVVDVTEWARARREQLIEQASVHGAVLFRGFGLQSAEDFDAFIQALDLPNFRYQDSLSNAVRVNRTERVFTANEAPPEVTICLHHEMAQTPVYPSRLLFFCEHAADAGGATPLCRSDALFERLEQECPEFARDCREKGLKYTNVMPPSDDAASGMGRSWQSTFSAESREAAEERMSKLDYTWEWQADGCLRATTPRLPAVRELAEGRLSFFNQLIAAFAGWKDSRNDPSKAITFGDGTPLDAAAVQRAIDLADEYTFDLAWQTGDVALVDNFVAMHGRRTFSGTRKVLASLVAAD